MIEPIRATDRLELAEQLNEPWRSEAIRILAMWPEISRASAEG